MLTSGEKAKVLRFEDVGRVLGHSTPEEKRQPVKWRQESQWQRRPVSGSLDCGTATVKLLARQRQRAVILASGVEDMA